jgi:hypothetical protein
MKNTIILFIAALLMCTAQAWAQTTRTWEMTPTMTAMLVDGTLTISTTQNAEDMPDYDYRTAPWYEVRQNIVSLVIADGVASIGDHAFFDCYNMSSVTIPNSVTTIGRETFQSCGRLTSITIPSSVTTISSDAFVYCEMLTAINVDNGNTAYSSDEGVVYNKSKSILHLFPGGRSGAFTIPSSVTTIGNYAFKSSKLSSVIIPGSVTKIEDSAFAICYGLTSITIPNSVTEIGHGAFQLCHGLTSVTIPSSVMSIGVYAFGYCQNLASILVDAENAAYSSDDGVLYNKSKTLLHTFPTAKSGAFTVPASVIAIGHDAFSHSKLSSVTIPASVTDIGSMIFWNCNSLEDITVNWSTPLPINVNVFYEVNTAGITLHVPYGTEELYRADAVWGTFNIVASPAVGQTWNLTPTMAATLVDGTLTISTTQNAEDMPDYHGGGSDTPWYSVRETITSVIIEDGVTSIGNCAFFSCFNLSSIVIPNSVITIGSDLFTNCRKLTSVTIPGSVTTIRNMAFFACGLSSIIIPGSVTSIGVGVFGDCLQLTSIYVDAENAVYSSGDGVLYNKDKSLLHSYPGGKSGAFIIPASVTVIGDFAFDNCPKLTSVTIPGSVVTIGGAAFQGCSGLTSVTIPGSVTEIGSYVFNNCFVLTDIYVDAENTVYSSGDGVLYNKDKSLLHSYPNGKSGAFVIPASVMTIGNGSFWGCRKLTSVTIPNSVTSMGRDVFISCDSLADITVNWSTPLAITERVFQSVTDITLYVPSGTKALYEVADVWKDFLIVESPSPVGTQAVVLSSLKAYSTDAGLHVHGLTPGEPLRVYNIAGQLIYKGISAATEQDIPLYAHGIYIITTGKQSVKAAY